MKVRQIRSRFQGTRGVRKVVGRRCRDYCAGCIVCDFYRFFDEAGRYPRNFDEAQHFSDECVRREEVQA